MKTPARPAAIASIRPTNPPVRGVTGVAAIAITVKKAFRRSSHRLMPSTPRR